MKKVNRVQQIPENSIIVNGFGKISYWDTYQVQLQSNDYSVDKITTDIFKAPTWVDSLMSIRNRIVSVFGLKTGAKVTATEITYSIGSKIGYFTVSDRNENEIVMAENDKHLNFRTSVLVEKYPENSLVYLSTLVQFNNFFGWLYFLPVKPFHRIIIQSLLKKYVNEN